MDLVPASIADKPTLLALNEYYTYDFSEMLGLDVQDDGRFDGKRLERHFEDPLCHPFLIRVAGKLAGFALHEGRSRLTGEPGIHDVAEFFVMRKYRRLGIGARASTALFQRFPGSWEVRQVAANVGATAFWRKVIHGHTGGGYDEVAWDTERFRGVVQRFRSER
jgi:predicted acetyltransferase